MKPLSSLSALGAGLLLALLTAVPFQVAASATAAPAREPIRAAAKPPIVRIDKVRARPSDEVVGKQKGGMFCSDRADIVFDEKLGDQLARALAVRLAREMDRLGYPPTEASTYDPDAKVDYLLAMTLVDVKVAVCGEVAELSGTMDLTADVELYAPRERRVVYRATHKAQGLVSRDKLQPWVNLVTASGTAMARTVLADPAFAQQAARAADQAAPAQAGKSDTEPPALKLAQLHGGAATSAQAQLPQLQSSVATLFSGSGSASTFLLAADGHWLTAQHAVGDAKFVKIKLPSGRELLGEVLRTDRRRDVALIKTEPVALAPLTVSDRDAVVGGDVYALGSPLGERLEGTVTRGIVSSYREIEGQRLLQSDVKILPGSSGGPLVDQRGAVVGLARGAIGDTSTSMNFFVPISEVLKALSITTR